MKCPKCGYERQSRDDAFVPPTECPACSVVYSKHESPAKTQPAAGAVLPAHLRPSPVDPQSLRKARERVEQRLRKNMKEQKRDERHVKTLQLAKRLTAEQVRLRRQEWQDNRTNIDKTTPEDSPAASENLAQAEPTPPPAKPVRPPAQFDAQRQAPDTVESLNTDDTQQAKQPPDTDEATPAITLETAPAPVEKIVTELENTVEENISAGAAGMDAEQAPPGPCPLAEKALPKDDAMVPPAHLGAMALGGAHAPGRSGLNRLLPIVAWLILIAGVIGAVLSWITISDVQAGLRFPIPDDAGSLPIGLLLGFAYLATGILGFAFFWVSSLISLQLKDIRQILLFTGPAAAAPVSAEEGHNTDPS